MGVYPQEPTAFATQGFDPVRVKPRTIIGVVRLAVIRSDARREEEECMPHAAKRVPLQNRDRYERPSAAREEEILAARGMKDVRPVYILTSNPPVRR